jgi:hypothetical protein
MKGMSLLVFSFNSISIFYIVAAFLHSFAIVLEDKYM